MSNRRLSKSKMKDPRHWRKLYASGSVKQKEYPDGLLSIEAMSIHHSGPAAGHTVLSLGKKVVSPGRSAPLCTVVVPTDDKYCPDMVLLEIPKHAIPVDLFFGK